MKLKTNKKIDSTQPGLNGAAGERGAALAMAMIVMVLIGVVTMTVLAVVSNEARISGSDLQRTQTCYVAAAKIEKMTSDFSSLFSRTTNPTSSQLNTLRISDPAGLTSEGFSFPDPILERDEERLADLRAVQGIVTSALPRVTIPSGAFSGLSASVSPYKLGSTAQMANTGVQCRLERTINNYLIPLFQFGMFSDKDIELHPGPAFTFNGRVHANGNIYVNGNVTFLDKVTTANELVRDVLRNDSTRTSSSVKMVASGISVAITKGSVIDGPNLPGTTAGQRGYNPGSPDGTANTTWESTSVASPATGTPDQFGGQILTRTTGASRLLLPLQVGGNPTREIIKRGLPADDQILSESRYGNKAQIRILLEDESVPAGTPGSIPVNAITGLKKGVNLADSSFKPMRLPNLSVSSGGGRALWRITDTGTYITTSSDAPKQGATSFQADTVRNIRNAVASSDAPDSIQIPPGAGITGQILIEIVDSSGTTYDVTKEILSMGMTVGEPNGIVYLQRPMWAAFTPGSRDAAGATNYLTYLLNNRYCGQTGEVAIAPTVDASYGFLTNIQDDSSASVRANTPPATTHSTNFWNAIVPINVYNVREGMIRTSLAQNAVYERGITSVVELNMRNLARWVDGVYDSNLLSGTNAVSAKIDPGDGYIVYVSDRRGDRVKSEKVGTFTASMTNGIVDNEDIYGANNALDPGEDVIDFGFDGTTGVAKAGTLQRDLLELPEPAVLAGTSGADWTARINRAKSVAAWTNPSNFFRRAVRLFNGEDLQITGATNKLSTYKGITVATENMLYIWGSYNTTGINLIPAGGATLAANYTGDQIPSSIVADAIFPLSKTWFDASAAIYPDNLTKRIPDLVLSGGSVQAAVLGNETAVRSAVIAGTNMSALTGTPDAEIGADSRLSGGVHNFPRFLEGWVEGTRRWNYIGSLVPMYYSTQALSPWQYPAGTGLPARVIYGAPVRNWAFDDSFRDPTRLPPGTPLFQYIEPTGFKQVLR
jgi:hypothetical protein